MSDDYVPSPCINICTIDPDSGYCMGCSRTQEEIDKWGYPDTTKEWKENNLKELDGRA
tara:strand:- start:300 stop:473 length:174 start_codon:yes stop_codon:yes gene_type:complete